MCAILDTFCGFGRGIGPGPAGGVAERSAAAGGEAPCARADRGRDSRGSAGRCPAASGSPGRDRATDRHRSPAPARRGPAIDAPKGGRDTRLCIQRMHRDLTRFGSGTNCGDESSCYAHILSGGQPVIATLYDGIRVTRRPTPLPSLPSPGTGPARPERGSARAACAQARRLRAAAIAVCRARPRPY